MELRAGPLEVVGVSSPLAGRRVWLSGHTGFMGSWLALWLHRRGAQVFGFALDPATTPANFLTSEVAGALAADVRADVRDAEAVFMAMCAADPEVVLHLAAQPLVRASYREPVPTFAANVMGTTHVLDAVRRRSRPCAVVIATTDKCYEPHRDGRAHREGDRLGGHDPYAASKAAAELVTDAYRRSFFPVEEVAGHGVQVATVRAGNAIGGGDWAEDRIVPDAVRAWSAGVPLEVRMPHAVRPWQHVLEPLSGYLRLAEAMVATPRATWCRGWNFAPADTASGTVEALLHRLHRSWRGASIHVNPVPGAPHETHLLRLDASDARELLGWRPAWTWEEAVDRTAAWYSAYSQDSARNTRAVCLADIHAHEEATR